MRRRLVVFAFVASLVSVASFTVQASAADPLVPPVVTSALPASAVNTSGDTITLTGTNFGENATVRFDDVVASNVTFIDESTLTVTAPVSNKFGKVAITVANDGGMTSAPAQVFSYLHAAPQVSSLVPDAGRTSGGQQVTVNGSGFYFDIEFSSLSASASHTCGISFGEVYCWGVNSSGQLGNNTTTNSNIPIKVTQEEGLLRGKTATAITTDGSSSCAVASGEAYCWGTGGTGRLGHGSQNNSLVPVKVTQAAGVLQGKTVTAIAAGSNGHACAIADAEVYCWGNNANGQLGIGSTTQSNVPVKVTQTAGILQGKTVTDVNLGQFHSCVVASGEAYCWGNNNNGQLGNNSTVQTTVPVKVMQAAGVLQGKTVTSIGAGTGHTCAIADGEVYCWGLNTNNQLGTNTTTQFTVPVKTSQTADGLLGKQVTKLSTRETHTCVIANGEVYCWGAGASGRLGNGSAGGAATPFKVIQEQNILLGKTVTDISAGAAYSCAVAAPRTYCWGANTNGQFGNNTTTSTVKPIDSTPSIALPLELSVDGIRRNIASQTPTAITFFTAPHATGSVDVSLGAEYIDTTTVVNGFTYLPTPSASGISPSSAYTNGGDTVTITGANFAGTPVVRFGGTLATNVTVINDTTLQVVVPASVTLGTVDVTISNSDGTVLTLDHAFTYQRPTPSVTVSPNAGPIAGGQSVRLLSPNLQYDLEFTKISASESHTCGLANAKVYCWGRNTHGQLGDNTTVDKLTPTLVDMNGALAGKTIVAVSTGGFTADSPAGTYAYTLALDSNGKVYAWGRNNYGQLGNGTTTNSLVPIDISGSGALAGKTITSIDAGGAHSLALASDGSVYSWGYNAFGQVGNGTLVNAPAPVAVTTGAIAGTTIRAVDAGVTHSVVLDSDGLVYAWGNNRFGDVGDGTTTVRTSPVAVSTANALAGKTITSISAGGYYLWNATNGAAYSFYGHTVVKDDEGKLYSWGAGQYGQLGTGGAVLSNPLAAAVTTSGALANKVIASVYTGNRHTVAVDTNGAVYTWGYGGSGQIGVNTYSSYSSPVAVVTNGVLAGKTIKAVSAGEESTFALDTAGRLYAWGANVYGQAGDGTTAAANTAPIASTMTLGVPYALTLDGANQTFAARTQSALIFTTPAHVAGVVPLVLTADHVDTFNSSYEYLAAPIITSVVPNIGNNTGGDTITITGNHFSDTPEVWLGAVSAAQITRINDTTITATVPPSLTVGSVDVRVVNRDGQMAKLASGFTYMQPAPVITTVNPTSGPAAGGQTVSLNGSGFYKGIQFTQVSLPAGNRLGCGIADAKAYCWGINSEGQIGNNSIVNSSVPVEVARENGVLAGKTVTSISSGQTHACAIADGEAYCWGAGGSGQLGNGLNAQSNVPVKVTQAAGVLAGKVVTSISAGSLFTCAIADGEAYCWGSGTSGRLGNGSGSSTNVPIKVTQAAGFLQYKVVTDIAAGTNHTCAVADGEAYCWGLGTGGILGNGGTASVTTPVKVVQNTGVLLGKIVTKVSASQGHTCAIADGEAYCWGTASSGQLGNGSTSQSNVPVKVVPQTGVLAGKVVTSISAANQHTCAIADGEAYCWGIGTYGRLGDGSTSGANSLAVKVAQAAGVLQGKTVQSVATGIESTCVVANGQLYCWGRNSIGELGNGTTTQSTTPSYATQLLPINFTITIGGQPASVTSQAQNSLGFITPEALDTGLVDIQLVADGVEQTTLANAYEYVAAPNVTSVSPATGFKVGGDTVTITGTGFSSNPLVRFGGQLATNVVRVSSTTLTVTLPAAAVASTVDVSVENGDGQISTLPNSFTYLNPAPTISSITPNQGPTVGGTAVTITGTNFADKNTTTNTWSNTGKTITGGTYGAQVAVVDSKLYMYGGYNTNTILSADVSDPTTWTNTGKTLPGALYGSQLAEIGSKLYLFGGYGSSAIYSADVSDPTTWTNTGKTLPGALGYSQVAIVGTKVYLFGGIGSSAIFSADVSDPTTWTNTGKTLPSNLGYSQVVVLDSAIYLFGGNTATGSAGNHTNVIYSAPKSDPTTWTNTGSALPVNLALSQIGVIGDSMYLFGGALSTGAYTNAIYTASTSSPLVWTNSNKTLPGNQAISHFAIVNSNMYLFAGVGAGSNIIYSAPVTYGEPNIYNKTWITNWQTTDTGAGTSALEVRIGGVLATNIQFVNGTTITAQTPAGLPGAADVFVKTLDGQTATLTQGYEYLGPQITGVSPSTGSTLGGNTVTITGNRFVQDGTTPPRVLFGSLEATSVQFISATELRVVAPAQAAGVVGITVENYDGESTTNANAYTYVRPPVVQSASPNEGPASGGDVVTITGVDFDNGAIVRFGGIESTQTTYINSTTLTAVSPAHYVGPKDISVTNLDGQVSSIPGAFTYYGVPPTISSLTPNVGPVAGGTQVTITGTGFDSSYKRAINVLNETGQTKTNAKALVQVNTATLIATGKMRSDGGDIRFQTANGEQLDYWVESGINTAATYIWVNIPSAPNGTTPIFMTYGVPSLTSQSDPSVIGAGDIDTAFTPITLDAQQLYVAWAGNNQNTCKSWSAPGGGLINEFTASQATESGYDFFSVTADGTQRYRSSGTSSQTVTLVTPVRTLTACLTTDSSNQSGYGGQVSAVKAQQLQGLLSTTVGLESVGVEVFFGDQPATVTQVSSTQIRATSPAHVPGRVSVSVTNPYTEPVVRADGFTYISAFGFSNAPLSLSATEPGKLTIESRDANGQPVASNVDTEIMLSSSSNGGFFARDINEDIATRWDYTSVILPAGQTSVDVWYRDATSGTPTITGRVATIVTFTQVQSIGSRYKLQVTGVSDPVQVGVPSSVTVRVVDYTGVPQSGYTGTIRFSSGDQAAILPANYAMLQSDNGIKTFVNGVTMRTQGEFCVSAADTVDSRISGEQCDVTALPPNQGAITQLAIISAEQSFPSNGYSSPITIQAQDANGLPISVTNDTQVYLYSDSLTGEFRTVGQQAWSTNKPYVATIEAGLTSVNVQYRDATARTSVLSARDVTTDTADNGAPGDFGWTNATQPIVSGVGAPTKLSVSGPTRLPASDRGAYVVEVQDADGNPVTAESDIAVRIDGSTATSSFYLSSDPQSPPLSGPIEFIIAGGTHRTTIWFSDSVSSEPGEFTTLSLTDARPETESVRLTDATYDVTIGLGDPLRLRVSDMAENSVRKNSSVHVDMLDEFGNVTYYDEQTTDIALSSNLEGVFGSNELTVSPGQTGATTTYYGLEAGTHAITASANGLESDDNQVTVTPISLAFMPVATTSADEQIAIEVLARNQAGDTITLDAPETTINLSTNALTGSFAQSSLVLGAGAQTVSTSYLDTAVGARTLQATSPHQDVATGTLEFTVTPGAYAQFNGGLRFTGSSKTYIAGEPQSFGIGFYDKAGRLTTLTSDVTVQLTTTSQTGAFSLANSPFTPVTSVTVPAGSQTIELYYRDETVGVPDITIRDAIAPGGQGQQPASATQTQEVVAAAPARVEVTSEPQLIAINTASTPIAFALKDAYGNDAVAPQNLSMTISSDSAQGEFALVQYEEGVAQAPTNWQQTKTITFAAGDHSTEVFYRDATVGTHSLSGAVSGITAGSQAIEVVLGFPQKTAVTSNDASVVAGEVSSFIVALQMEDGTEVAATSATNVALSASDGEISLTETPFEPVSQISFAKGVSRQTIFFRSTSVGTNEITATSFGTESSDTVEVIAAPFARFGVTPLTSTVPISTASSPMTITMYDVYGNVSAPESDTTAYFYSDQATTDFAINEDGPWNLTSVVIPAGLTSQSFFVQDSAFHDGAVNVTVSDYPALDQPDIGIENGSAAFTVVGQPVSQIAFTTSPREVTAGGASQAITFELQKADGSPAIQDGTTQALVRVVEDEGHLTLAQNALSPAISAVTIGANEATGTMYYTGQKAGTFTVEVSMQSATITQSVTVNAAEFNQAMYTTLPQSVTADQPSGAIRVVFQDEYGNQVALNESVIFTLDTTCDGTGVFSETNAPFTPTTLVQAQAGSQDLTFYYKDTQAGQCTIEVSAPGIESINQVVTISAGMPSRFDIVGNSTTLVKGQSSSLVINLLDAFGNIAQATRTTTALMSTTSPTGQFVEQSVSFATGQSTRNVNYVDTIAGTATVAAQDQAGLLGGDTKTITYTEGEPAALRITPNPSTMRAGANQELQVTVVNEFGVTVEAIEDMDVSLLTSAASGRFVAIDDASGSAIQTVQIREGESQASVAYTQTASGATTLSAQYADMSGTAQLTVLAESVYEIRFSNTLYEGEQALEIGEPGTITARLYDEYGNVTTTDTPLTLYASANLSGGAFANNGRIVIAAGGSQGSVTFTAETPATYEVTVSDTLPGQTGGALDAIEQSVEVIYGDAATFKFDRSGFTLERGGVTDQMTATLYNSHDRVVPAGVDGHQITLSMYEGTGAFAQTANGTFNPTLVLSFDEGQSAQPFFYRNDTAQIENRQCYTSTNGARSCYTAFRYEHTIRGTGDAELSASRFIPVTMQYGAAVRLVFTTPDRAQPAQHPSQVMTVEQQNQYGKPVITYSDTQFYVRSSAGVSGEFGSSMTNWGVNRVTMLNSSSSVNFYYKDTQIGTHTITLADSLPLTEDTGRVNATQPVTIEPQVVDNLLVTNISDPQAQGTPSSVVVIARDSAGYTVESYDGLITFSSNDQSAILPSSYTFNPAIDKGSKTFTNAVAFRTPGEKFVRVTDEAGITGVQDDITVTGANTAPVAQVVFSQPDSPMETIRGATSPAITVQLRDSSGTPTTAGESGYGIRLTTSSPTAQFAMSPNGPWLTSLVTTVPEGLSYLNVYYRDTTLGSAQLLVSDWNNSVNNPDILDGTLEVITRTIRIEGENTIQSQNAFGKLEDSALLFAHNAAGDIGGSAQNNFRSFSLETGAAAIVDWRLQWRQGVSLLQTTNVQDQDSTSLAVNPIQTTAGRPDFYAIAEATTTSFETPSEVVSRQLTIPTSPWRVAATPSAEYAKQDTAYPFTVTTRNNTTISGAPTTTVQVLRADATDASAPLYGITIEGGSGQLAGEIPAGLLELGEYRILATAYDVDGNVIAQDLSSIITVVEVIPEPEVPVDPGTVTPPGGETPTQPQPGQTPGTVVPPSTQTPSENGQPSENTPDEVTPPVVDETPVPSDSTQEPASGGLWQAIKNFLQSPNAPTIISGALASVVGLIIVALIYQAYKEWRQARWLLALIKRDQQTVADKDAFLNLAAHYLRTPMSLIDSGASLLQRLQGDEPTQRMAAALQAISSSMRTKVESILAQTANSRDLDAITAPSTQQARINTLLTPIFWVPVILSIILSLLANWMIGAVGERSIAGQQLMQQFFILMFAGILLYMAVRFVTMRRERRAKLEASRDKVRVLNAAKMNFVQQTYQQLSDDVLHLSGQDMTRIQNDAVRQAVNEGTVRLKELVSRFAILSSIRPEYIHAKQFNMHELVDDALRELSEKSRSSLRINNKVAELELVQDERFLGKVMGTILEAVSGDTKLHDVNIEGKQSKSGTTTVTLTSQYAGTLGAPGEELFSIYSNEGNEEAATYDNDEGKRRLDLYLDRMIMTQLGGEIETQRTRNSFEVKLTMPSHI